MMSSLENIQKKVADLRAVEADMNAMRTHWAQTTAPFLMTKLQEIQATTGITATIALNADRQNLESVEFSMANVPSGISFNNKMIGKMGAKLIFAQNYHGHVCAMTLMPTLEGLMQPQQPNVFEVVKPEKVDENFVLRYVETFLDQVIDWEDGETTPVADQRSIGFLSHKNPKV